MQAVEQAHQVIAGAREFLGGSDLEPGPLGTPASAAAWRAAAMDVSWLSTPRKVDRPNALAMMIVDAPSPHPTSATLAPACSLARPRRPGREAIHSPGGRRSRGGRAAARRRTAGHRDPASRPRRRCGTPRRTCRGRRSRRRWSRRHRRGRPGCPRRRPPWPARRAARTCHRPGHRRRSRRPPGCRATHGRTAPRCRSARPGPGEVTGPARRHRLVEAEPVADVQQQPRDGRAHVGDRLPDECLQPCLVDLASCPWWSCSVSALRMRVPGGPVREACARSSVAASVPSTDPPPNPGNPCWPPMSSQPFMPQVGPVTTPDTGQPEGAIHHDQSRYLDRAGA